jgi:gliding motility-associated-like protein
MSLLEERNTNFSSLINESSRIKTGNKFSTLSIQKVAISPFDTCATHTFRLKIGTDNSNDEVSDITALRSGDVLVAGKTNKNNQQDDALLIRLDASGSIVWLKTFGENDRQEVFYKARETSDGGIIAIGSVFGPVTGEGYILICKMDGNGNLQWTRKYRSTMNSFARGSDIIELTEGNFVFLGDDRVKLLYGKLSSSGNILWNQEVKVSDSTRALNLIENDFQGIYIASAGMDTGWHVSNLIEIARSNGNVNWRQRLGGSVMQAHYIFQKMQLINLRPRITGIYAAYGQPYQFMRLNGNGSSGFDRMERYNIPGVNPDTTSNMVLTPWAEAVAFSPGNNTNTISIFQHIPDVQQVPWGYSYTATANLQLTSIEKTPDAGFLAACNIANNSASDILLIKVDSAGLSPGCEGSYINVANTIIVPVIPGSSASGIINSLVIDNNTITPGTAQLDSIYYCRQLTCPVRPVEDTCLATFTKHYRSYEFCEVATTSSMTPDGHLILFGVHRDNPYDASWERSFIIKTDNKGNLVAKKRLSIGQNCRILVQTRLADNTILAAGYFIEPQTASGFFLAKLDNDLNIIWTKNYSVIQTSWHFSSIAEAADGSIFISMFYHDFVNLNDRMVLTKLNNTGNFLWQKMYRPTGSVSLFAFDGSLITSGQDIYFESQVFYDVEQRWKTLVTKIDQSSGNILWSKRYSYAGRHTEFNGGIKMSANSFYYSGFIDLPSQAGQVFMKIDGGGNILRLAMHTTPVGTISYSSRLAANSDILLSGGFTDYSVNPAISYRPFVRLDSNFNIRLSKKSPMITYSYSSGVQEDQQGFVYVYGTNGYNSNYNADLALKKYTYDGNSGSCPSDSFEFDQPMVSLTVADQPMISTSGSSFPVVVVPFSEINFSLQQNGMFCGSVSGCDTLWLNGPVTICDSSSAFTFYANKNLGCHAAVNWNVSPSTVEIQQQTDSLIKVRFLQNTTFTIRAQLLTGCRIFTDSLEIVTHSSPQLRLCPDTSLCPNNSLLLNARSGFQTYLWQDNSTDSTFLVTSPGTYFVETTDACGNISKDTVIVSAAPPIPFDLGPDLLKCNGDSVTLSSPGGFINYTWSPPYNMTQSTGQSVIVFPDTDTSYMVKAEKTPGCFAYDTVHITVHHSPQINLGADTSFCIGASATLNAGTSFQTYAWSTGASTQQIQVQSAGTYSILATTIEGCRSYDTLRVLNVYNKPTINLAGDAPLCANTTRILDAGPGFKTYVWSNGSAGQTISVNAAATYWVLVTDVHDCSNSDTTIVTGILASPSAFLPADTSLCSYASMQIKPVSSFSSYLWNTGSTGNSITVTQAGWYWLQVKDNFSCEGRDSILINPKQCLEGFYIPNAFTPNNDGNNDIFRPLLFGIVSKYKFSVYNRWGEKVFETTSLQSGWDGKVRGIFTDSNVFVWECSFQFQGQRTEFKKGTFVLIR